MGKNKARKQAEALAAKAAANKKQETTTPPAAQTPPVEKEEKPVADNKPAANKPAVETKKEDKPQVQNQKPAANQPKKGGNKPTPKEAPVVEAEVVEEGLQKKEQKIGTALAGVGKELGGSKCFSPDAKANLAYVIQKRYGENDDLKQTQPALCASMMENLDVVVALSMVDLRNELKYRESTGEIKLICSPDSIVHLKEVCATLGIELAPAKALPAPGDKEQLEINFTESTFPPELTPQTRAEAGVTTVTEDVIPELEIAKIENDDQLKAALEYLLAKSSKERNIAESIFNTVEWYKKYCLEKEKDAAKLEELNARSISQWLDDIFKHSSPTLIFRGLGSTLYGYCAQMGSPIMSHCILHRHLSPLGWNEEQIAEVLKTIIQKKFQMKKDEKPEVLESEDKALLALLSSKGIDYINNLIKDKNNKESEIGAVPICTNVRSAYFSNPEGINDDMIRMKIGQILNLYRSPMERMEEFAGDMLAPNTGEYPTTAASTDEKKN